MLEIVIKPIEMFDNEKQEFIMIGPNKPVTLRLEHSLISISKWESKYKKYFLSREDKTLEELQYYIKCMSINGEISDDVIKAITQKQFMDIQNYIGESQTATKISHRGNGKGKSGRGEQLSSELIYYYMSAFTLPIQAEKWHLSRLLALIEIASVKNAGSTNMSKKDIYRQNASLNAARRKAAHSKG